MTREELIKLAADEPEVIETTAAALRRVIDFNRGRGAMLAQLHLDPQVRAIVNKVKGLFRHGN